LSLAILAYRQVLFSRMTTLDTKPRAKKVGKWLAEIHNKLWGQEHLRDRVIRTVELNSTHYRELQARLNEKHPNRNSDSYNAQDVLSVKLDLLLNFTPSSPPPIIDWDDDDADYDDIEVELMDILPAKIAFLDLSSLDLKNRVDIPFPMLIRKEYEVISTLMNEGTNDVASGCILTGQSGIGRAIHSILIHGSCLTKYGVALGKSTFVYMLLIERILKASETYFEGPAGDLYSISDAGVKEVHSMSSLPPLKGKNRIALLDGPATHGMYRVSGTGTRIVCTSSLQDHRSRTSAIRLLGASRASPVYLMDGWSMQELMLTGYAMTIVPLALL
jgi:hypothetical protein